MERIPKVRTLYHGPRDVAKLYLSFDDGPDQDYSKDLLAILSHYRVHANFFLLGSASARNPLLTQYINSKGHTLGCHGFSHSHPWRIGADRARAEVARGFFTLRHITGKAPRLFRPPYGRRRYAMEAQARHLGMRTVLWSRSAMDWGWWGKAPAIAQRLSRCRNGDILLLHDGRPTTNKVAAMLEVLPAFIENCHQRGFTFGSLHELIAPPAATTSSSPLFNHEQLVRQWASNE